MSSVSEPNFGSLGESADLEAALEEVLIQLEAGEPVDHEQLQAKYPQWSDEIHELIDNWLGIERKTGQLAINTAPVVPWSANESQVFGDYQLERVIGSGGMGIIYKAKQLSLARPVAVKMIMNPLQDRGRFRVEAESAAALHHDNIVSIYEVGEFQGHPFISMQYVEGCNLRDHLSGQPVAPEDAARLVEVIARAVHYAHQRGILHRDLKPANVLLDAAGKPYITDFGLAKQMGVSAELTRSGAVLGTPGYMSPEQAMGQVKSITVTADVYGLGAILYTMLTGVAPFTGESDLKTLRHVVENEPRRPRSMCPKLDSDIETICLKCLEKVPSARYSSASRLAEDLARYVRGEPVLARPVGSLGRKWQWCRRNPAMACMSIVAVGLLLCSLLFLGRLAYTESRARLDAESASMTEAALRSQVELSRDAARLESKAARHSLAELYTTNGLWASQSGDYSDALLWFAQAAKTNAGDPDFEEECHARCRSWLADCPIPVAAIQLPDEFDPSTFRTDMRLLAWRPTGEELMFRSGTDFVVLNPETGVAWRPATLGLQVSAAGWSKDGQFLALGSQEGEIRILDSNTRELKTRIDLAAPVRFLAFANQGTSIAVATSNEVRRFRVTGDSIGNPIIFKHPIRRFVFSPDDRSLVTVTEAGRLTCHSIDHETHTLRFDGPCYVDRNGAFSQEFVPTFARKGSIVNVRIGTSRVLRVDSETGESKQHLPGGTGARAIVNRNDYWVVCGSFYAREWTFRKSVKEVGKGNDLEKGKDFERHVQRLSHEDRIVSIDLSTNGWVATGSLDRSVKIWKSSQIDEPGLRRNEAMRPLAVIPHMSQVVRVLFSPDATQLATFQRDGLVRIWKLPTFEAPGYKVAVPPLAAVAKPVDDKSWLVSGATHKDSGVVNASLRRLSDGGLIAETLFASSHENGFLMDAAVSDDQRELTTIHSYLRGAIKRKHGGEQAEGFMATWSLPSGKPIDGAVSFPSEPRCLAIHHDEIETAVLCANGVVYLVDSASTSVVRRIPRASDLDSPEVRKEHNDQALQPSCTRSSAVHGKWQSHCGVGMWQWSHNLGPTGRRCGARSGLDCPPASRSNRSIPKRQLHRRDDQVSQYGLSP